MTSGSPLGVCITAGDAWKTLPTPCPQNRGTTPTLFGQVDVTIIGL